MGRAVGVLCLVALLAGCAFDRAMERGDALAAAGQWREALAAYEEAQRADPTSTEAIEAASVARIQLARAALERARVSLDARDYQGALRRVDEAEAVSPGMAETAQVQEAITTKVLAEARDLLGGGHFRDGIALLELLRGFRPELGSVLDRTVGQAEADWAARLRAEAVEDERAGRLGPAFVRFAMAASLDNNPDDAASRDRLRQAVMKDAVYLAQISVSGEAPRASEVSRRVMDRIQRPGRSLRLSNRPRTPGAVLSARLAAPACGQQTHVEVATHRYISGKRQVQNPEWLRRREEIRSCERDVLGAEDQADRALDALEDAEDRLDDAARDPKRDLSSFRNEVERRRRELRDARRRMRDLRRGLLDLRDRLDQVPLFLEEDEWSTFNYEVRHVERHCQVGWEASLVNADGSDPRTIRQGHRQTTSDDTHQAHVRYGINEDPLRFSMDDGALVEMGDEAAAAHLAAAVVERFRAHRLALVTEAAQIEGSEPARATTLLVQAYLLEPGDDAPGAGKRLADGFKMRDPAVLAP